MIEENHEKTSVRLVDTGIWTRDLPNASLVRYHGATSLAKERNSVLDLKPGLLLWSLSYPGQVAMHDGDDDNNNNNNINVCA